MLSIALDGVSFLSMSVLICDVYHLVDKRYDVIGDGMSCSIVS